MKTNQQKVEEAKAEILEQAKCIASDPDATPGSRVLAAYIDYMRTLLKELVACKE